MKNPLLFLAVILIIHSSCKKDTEAVPVLQDYQFKPEFLSYVQLPLNSYFIYKDSATSVIDSVVVKESILERLYMPEQRDNLVSKTPAYNYQNFRLALKKYSGSSATDWFEGFASAVYGELKIIDRLRNIAYGGPAFYYSLTTYNTVYSAYDIMPQMTVEGKTYNNVIMVMNANTSDTTASFYYRSTYYWAKGVGIIKREVKTPGNIKTELLIRNG